MMAGGRLWCKNGTTDKDRRHVVQLEAGKAFEAVTQRGKSRIHDEGLLRDVHPQGFRRMWSCFRPSDIDLTYTHTSTYTSLELFRIHLRLSQNLKRFPSMLL